MGKTLWTLLRGAAFAAKEAASDRAALLILDQHRRDATAVTPEQAR